MPIYEYECDKGHHFEVSQRISEDRLDTCIECGAPAERLISASAFILKGGGWYAQGYGNAAGGAASAGASSTGGDAGGGESAASSPAESKSATAAGAIKTGGDGGGASST